MRQLVASGLAMILLLILTAFFVDFRRVHLQIDRLVDQQEKARVLHNIFQQAKNNAGFIACRKLSSALPIYQQNIPLDARITPNNYAQTFSATHSPAFIHAKPVSEVSVFRYLLTPAARLIDMPENNQLVVSYLPKFKAGDLIAVADCERVHVLYVTHVSRSAVKQQQVLSLSRAIKPRFKQGEVGELITVAFYEAYNTRGKLAWYEDVLGREEIV